MQALRAIGDEDMSCDCRCCRVYGPVTDWKQREENFNAILKWIEREKKLKRKRKKWFKK